MASLLLSIIVSFLLRTAFLADFPPSLNWDEVSLGYNAYSLALTGRDEWAAALPLLFRAYGDFKLPVYIYAAVPFTSLFPAHPWAIRIPSVIGGVGLVAVGYLLAYRLFRSAAIARLTGLILALSPWGLFMSRIALEANLGIFIFSLGIVCVLSHRKSLGLFFLLLSAWTYNSFRVVVPVFLVGLVGYWHFRRSLRLSHLLILALLGLPLLYQVFSPAGQARYKWLSIIDSGAVARINELRSRPGGRLVYNKLTYSLFTLTNNYLHHFSPNFLFFRGGSHYQFSIPGHGIFYLVSLPFFYLGLLTFFSQRKNPNYQLLALWLLAAPLADSITRDSPHVLRAVPLLPVAAITTALGVNLLSKKIPNFHLLFSLALVFSLEFYLTGFAYPYRTTYSKVWQYGHSAMVRYVKAHYQDYDRVIISKFHGEPHEFVAYFWPWIPGDYQTQKAWDFHTDWYWVNSLGKIDFQVDRFMASYLATLPPGNYLVVADPQFPVPGKDLLTIHDLASQPVFTIKSYAK